MSARNFLSAILAGLALVSAVPSIAAVANVTPSGYLVTIDTPLKSSPKAVFAAIQQVGKWWSPDHTYSGNAGHLSIEMRAGGCFCERWNGNSVEHARVRYVLRDKALRLEGGLGPLQEMAVNGIMHFALEPAGDDTSLTFTYRVRGSAEAALDKTAASVDRVLSEQISRLVSFVETGSPVPVPPQAPPKDEYFSSDGARIRYIEEGRGADTVILLHDRGSNVEDQWRQTGIMAALAQKQAFRVIAMDLRGHGKSDKPSQPAKFGPEMALDVSALMAHLGIPRAHIVGYGLGANIAAYLAARQPERFITMTLAGGAQARADGGEDDRRELAVADEQMSAVTVPTLGLVGTRDPALRDLVLLKQIMPRLGRMVSLDDETHGSAPRNPEFVLAIQYFLRYHPGNLVK